MSTTQSDICDPSPVFLVIVLSVRLSDAVHSPRRCQRLSALLISVLVLTLVLAAAIIWRQPQSTAKAAFMVNWKGWWSWTGFHAFWGFSSKRDILLGGSVREPYYRSVAGHRKFVAKIWRAHRTEANPGYTELSELQSFSFTEQHFCKML